ncbi:MAG: hypothetical protein AVDCRST_MAG17-1070, partial [uncultured Solirubrobacterales bacterium]
GKDAVHGPRLGGVADRLAGGPAKARGETHEARRCGRHRARGRCRNRGGPGRWGPV